jgi:hypothetical protein
VTNTSVEAAFSDLDCVIDFQVYKGQGGAEVTYLPEYITAEEIADWIDEETTYGVTCID